MSVADQEKYVREVKLTELGPLLHPLAGCGYRQFWRHYFENWPFNLRSLHMRLFAGVAIAARAPTVFLEGRKHNEAIAAQELDAGPVFLVGHWRSGTTHLHNLLSQDPQFGCISFSRSAMPLDCLGKVRLGRTLINLLTPRTRGMDKVRIDADSPQEEEMALGAMGDVCMYKCFYFPRKLDYHFRRAVLFEDLRPGEREKLAEDYRYLVNKMSYLHRGKTVLFKNPASTARMAFLKEIFPKAKFVHIIRDPYSIYPSMMRLWDRLLNAFSWHRPKGIDFHEITLSCYERLMKAHLADRERIPAEDFHEIRYEELDSDPSTVVRGIYDALGLPGKEEAMAPIEQYIEEHKGYQKNVHELKPEIKEEVRRRWEFAFDHWGYDK